MSYYNKGYVFTNQKCIGCGRCMSQCPADETNISVYINGKRHLEVNSANCISCGGCMNVCTHSARDYIDDTDEFFKDLATGEKISLIVSSAFYLTYGERASNILGYLRSLGVDKIYDDGFGADIFAWLNSKFLKEYDRDPSKRPFIVNSCSTVINYIERYEPETVDYIIPVHSAPVCTAIYARKYLHDTSKIAYLSSCVSRKAEFERDNLNKPIDYSVTFAHLMKKLDGTDMAEYSTEVDLKTSEMGRLASVGGGIKEYIASFFPEEEIIVSYNELDENTRTLISQTCDPNIPHPFASCLASCKYGCVGGGGSGMDEKKNHAVYFRMLREVKAAIMKKKHIYADPEELYKETCEKFKDIDPSDFSRSFSDRYLQRHTVPEHIINSIFIKMHMLTEEDQNVNCQSCGYRTCREMVSAVAKGYAHLEDCSRYINSEFHKKLFFDDMTGLLSSQGYHMETSAMLRRNPGKKYIVCAGNINGIRTINDLYNFNVGSQVIVYVGRILSGIAGKDGICARLGGNIFVLCVENTPANISRILGLRYFDCSRMGINMPVTMRFGLCEVDGRNDLSRITNYASFAMEKNTERSRNSFIWYDENMRNEIVVEATITSQMRSAMANNEFTMYLQPQYNHSNRKIVGAESLCRWIKPDGTVISPGLFISIFEKNGFIKDLDRFMWEKAFKLVNKWTEQGVRILPISVNISRMSLVDDDIVHFISGIKDKYKINPDLIHFEITESAYSQNQEELIDRISKIREMGFKIAMDDFGSGYSSLNTLKDIPLDILKLDMGFLRGGTNAAKGGNIIGSVIRMAHSLDLITVAEGVETIKQADFLKSIGCDVIQGFLYARPMPVEDYEKIVADDCSEPLTNKNISVRSDINKFFDADSDEAKLFDNYIGPAAMFEYERGNLTIVRVNDSFIKMIGFTDVSAVEFSKTFTNGLFEKDRKSVVEAISNAEAGNTGVVTIFGYERPDGKNILIKAKIWYIGSNGQKKLIYTISDDVTDVTKYKGNI